MDPGPRFRSILNLQGSHRSDAIWDGEEYGVLTLRHHLRAFSSFPVPEAVINYLDNTQFRGLTRLCKVPLDLDLITTLVERWREETHTFHLPFGEVTITLQDVAMLFGLRISGKPVTGTSDWNWRQLCANLLGAIPSTISLKGSALKLVWLHDNFQNLPENAGEYQLHCYVRAYLLYLIGAVLFPDKSGNTVSLLFLPLLEDLTQLDEISWGSGVLACLYRNLCKATKKDVWQIAGPLLLLQFWSWERVSIGRPDIIRSTVPIVEGVAYPLGSQIRVGLDPLACKWLRVNRTYKDHRLGLVVIRDLLDKMVEMQFVWQSYTPNIVQHLSPTCVQDHEEWTVIAPLICFEMVEFHFPHRCMRQFGWHQVIPPLCNTCENLHAITRQGDSQTDYAALHKTQIAQWDNRLDKIMETGEPYCGLMRDDDPYLLWYRDITRLIVTPLSQNVNVDYDNYHYYYPTAADFQKLTQAHVLNYNTSEEMISNMSDDVPLAQYNMAERMRLLSLDALRSTRQGHLVNYEEAKSPSPSPPRYDFRRLEHRQTYTSQDSQEAEPSQRNRKKGKSRK